MNAATMSNILGDAAQSLRQPSVSMRVDTEMLESVYISLEGDRVVVSDRGATFFYIDRGDDDTYIAWSRAGALDAIRDSQVDLVGEESADQARYRLQLLLSPADDVGTAVERLALAIHEVFQSHTRPDLRLQ